MNGMKLPTYGNVSGNGLVAPPNLYPDINSQMTTAEGFSGGNYSMGSNWGAPQMGDLGGMGGGAGIMGSLPNTSLGGTGTVDPSIWSQLGNWAKGTGLVGSTDAKGIKTDGWGGLALGAGSALFNGYLGMQQYGLAKDSFNFQKDMALKNYENQKRTTNAALNDRQVRRNIERPDSMAAADYMAQYGVR